MTKAKIDAMNEVTGLLLDSANGHEFLSGQPQLAKISDHFHASAEYRREAARTIQNVMTNIWKVDSVKAGKGQGLSAYVSMLGATVADVSGGRLMRAAIKSDGYMTRRINQIIAEGHIGHSSIIEGEGPSRMGSSYDFVQTVMTVMTSQTEALASLAAEIEASEADGQRPEGNIEIADAQADEVPTLAEQAIIDAKPELADMSAPAILVSETPEIPEKEDTGEPVFDEEPSGKQEDLDATAAAPGEAASQDLGSETADAKADDYVTTLMPHSAPAPDRNAEIAGHQDGGAAPQDLVFETALEEKKDDNEAEQPRKLRVRMMKRPDLG